MKELACTQRQVYFLATFWHTWMLHRATQVGFGGLSCAGQAQRNHCAKQPVRRAILHYSGGGARRPRARAIAVGFALDILGRCLLWLENGGMGIAALWRGFPQGSHEYVL